MEGTTHPLLSAVGLEEEVVLPVVVVQVQAVEQGQVLASTWGVVGWMSGLTAVEVGPLAPAVCMWEVELEVVSVFTLDVVGWMWGLASVEVELLAPAVCMWEVELEVVSVSTLDMVG
jgi:hypothetical protein